jgi:hypothetical protein
MQRILWVMSRDGMRRLRQSRRSWIEVRNCRSTAEGRNKLRYSHSEWNVDFVRVKSSILLQDQPANSRLHRLLADCCQKVQENDRRVRPQRVKIRRNQSRCARSSLPRRPFHILRQPRPRPRQIVNRQTSQ